MLYTCVSAGVPERDLLNEPVKIRSHLYVPLVAFGSKLNVPLLTTFPYTVKVFATVPPLFATCSAPPDAMVISLSAMTYSAMLFIYCSVPFGLILHPTVKLL